MPDPEQVSKEQNGPQLPLSPNTTPLTYTQARQHLESVRARLSHTVQDYLAACHAMHTACFPTHQSSRVPSAEREHTLPAIGAEILALSLEQGNLDKANDILTATANRSKMSATIHSLPPEILARIFSEAACHCSNHMNNSAVPLVVDPISLSAVCRQWRQVATGHKPLWTHIDLIVNPMNLNGRYYSPDIWTERSRGALLYVHIFQLSLPEEYDEEECEAESFTKLFPDPKRGPAPMVSRLAKFLLPLMPRVCSLTPSLSWPYESVLNMLLDCWIQHGTFGQAKALKAQATADLGNLDILSTEAYKPFFESLEVLHLHNVVISWPDFTLHNLIELDIEVGEGEWETTPSELASDLSSCPKLQYLTLRHLHVKPDPHANTRPIPARLSKLRVLRVGRFSSAQMLESVLSIIDPGQNALSLDLSLSYLESPAEAFAAIHPFLRRSNITTLHVQAWYIDGLGNNPCFAAQLGPLPHVHTLVLRRFFLLDEVRYRLSTQDHPESHVNPRPIVDETTLWPQLQNLFLDGCFLENNHLRQLLSLHSIRTLHMRRCFDGYKSRIEYKNKYQVSEEYARQLSDAVPKVINSTERWGYWPSLSRDACS